MTNAIIDNSISGLEVVLWQYDKALNFIALIRSITGDFDAATEDFWDGFQQNVFDLTTANSFGLSVWGILLGKGRAMITTENRQIPISDDLYRKVLIATLRHLHTNRSMEDLNGYLFELFGGAVRCSDNLDMTITHTIVDASALSEEERLLLAQHPDYVFVYPAGVYEPSEAHAIWFGFEGQETNSADNRWAISNFGASKVFFSEDYKNIISATESAVEEK